MKDMGDTFGGALSFSRHLDNFRFRSLFTSVCFQILNPLCKRSSPEQNSDQESCRSAVKDDCGTSFSRLIGEKSSGCKTWRPCMKTSCRLHAKNLGHRQSIWRIFQRSQM